MNIISLINEFTSIFNKSFKENLNFFNLESKIRNTGGNFTLLLYEKFLNYLDYKFKNSKQRKKYAILNKLEKELYLLRLVVLPVDQDNSAH